MSTTPPAAGEPPEREDRRGASPGDPEKPHGHKRDGTDGEGRRGNLPFEPTEEQRAKVRTLAKTFPVHGEHYIARLMGFSRDTLRRHFSDDMEMGRAEMLASVGSQMVNRALDSENKTVKGDLDAQKYILARLGGWTTKVELAGRDGRPIETVDLSGMTPAALREYGRVAAIQQGLDPDEAVGPSLDD